MVATELFFVEIRTHDRAALAAWYVEALGLSTLLEDPVGDFSLLGAGPTRLGIKGGRPEAASGSIGLAFRVVDLASECSRLTRLGVLISEPEISREGYRSVRLADPGGHPIQLFEWMVSPAPEV
jgi:catechol 2,3-dioxygenase-like lactoylglutathione lyase family enzyme